MKNNKGLLFIATSLLTVIAFTVMATNQNSSLLIQSTADDESNKRSFSLDGNTPLSIDGTVGSLTVGNIGVRALNCSVLENGVATLIDTNYMFIYCSTAGTYGNSQKQYGFLGSNISSVSITVNNHNANSSSLILVWLNLDANLNRISESNPYKVTFNLDASSDDQTKTTIPGENFIANQHSGYNCIGLYHGKYSNLDIINISVEYSCR